MQTLASTPGISRRRLGRILGSTFVFSALVVVLVVFVLGKEETTARTAATKFAVALVHDKPTAAPRGAADYVGGVRDYFGPVSSARVIAAHNKGVNTGDNADTRSFFVV